MELRPHQRRSNSTSSDELFDGDFVIDFNEDSTSSSSDSAEEYNAQYRKKIKSSNFENGESSGAVVDETVENRVNDENTIKINKKNSREKNSKPLLLWQVREKEQESFINLTELYFHAKVNREDLGIDSKTEELNETAEASSDLIIPLLRFQKEWLAWALKQESSVRGGILADEMGMGKTIEAIALVLVKRELQQKGHEPDESALSLLPSSSNALPVIKGTLVICPVVAITQWVNEIDRCTLKGSTKVLVYHGARRAKSRDEFFDYDFVITSYSTVESEYTKYVNPKVECPKCGRFFNEWRLSRHDGYCYRSPDVNPERQSNQVKKDKSDVIHKDMALLHAVKWNRIILDEAHYLKNKCSNTTQAVLALECFYKWALTGTPFQNRPGELFPLVQFLQITPYSYYYCKSCDCERLDRRKPYKTSICSDCHHDTGKHFSWWNRYIAEPIRASESNYHCGQKALILLKHRFLEKVVLRRTKIGRAADIALPPRTVLVRRDFLDINEQDYYDKLFRKVQTQVGGYAGENNLMRHYMEIIELVTQLRQAADHTYLVEYSQSGKSSDEDLASNAADKQVCGVCHESEEQVCDLTSNKDVTDRANKAMIKDFRSSSILKLIRCRNFQTSTKLEALKEEIRFMIERDPSAKGIVFSQFTSFLDLIHYSLYKSGVTCVLMNGRKSRAARDAAIKRFNDDPDCRIFLMTLKTGGVALNLTVASNVFIMDPWWNPGVECQAQDRIHRIGQYKPTRVVRFIIGNSIEEKILKIQKKKKLIVEGILDGSSEAMEKLTVRDFLYIFSL